MQMIEGFTRQIAGGRSLSGGEIASVIEELVSEQVTAEVKAEFLSALAQKGETVEELAAFARGLREKALPSGLRAEERPPIILDVCGTGGDMLHTFNISTAVAFVAAAAGIPVAKHGNRAVSSGSGSADVLEALGIPIDLDPAEAARMLRLEQFAFFFAPKYHPAFKQIAPARKLCAARGQRTLFNLLGPLLNPIRPNAQLVGVPAPGFCRPISEVLQALGAARVMVVSGASGAGDSFLDEISPFGETVVAEFYQPKGVYVSVIDPRLFPIGNGSLADLRGGTPVENAQTIREILKGRERGPKRAAVLLNASAALWVGGRVETLQDGWTLAGEIIDDGRALARMERLAAWPRPGRGARE